METEEILAAIQKAAETIATPNCAAWFSAVAAAIAVVVAIVIAIKQNKIAKKQNEIAEKQADIAEQQNRIALFEKRYEVYFEISKIIEIYSNLNSTEPIAVPTMLAFFEAGLGLKISGEKDRYTMATMATTRLLELGHMLTQAIFLFPHINETDIENLLADAIDFVFFVVTSDKEKIDRENACVKKFFNTSKDFKEKYLEMIEKKLDLTGGV